MRPSGTIYRKSLFSRNRGELRISLPFRIKVFYNYLYFWGTCFLVASIVGVIFSFGPIISQEAKYQLRSHNGIDEPALVVSTVQAGDVEVVQKEAADLGINAEFSLIIPKIDARSNIIANVNTADEREYMDALTKGVAHAKGTYFPGQGKPVFLFAHSTNASINVARYNAVFYLLSKLEKGDRVSVYFANKKYEYEVTDSVVKPSNDTSFLYDIASSEKLYLMTCTPPGTTWKRLFVIAEPIQ